MMDGKDPRWTVTCTKGHTTRERAETRPFACPECGGGLRVDIAIEPDRRTISKQPSRGHKRASGSAALFTYGDGR
jgi:hypothetical protein